MRPRHLLVACAAALIPLIPLTPLFAAPALADEVVTAPSCTSTVAGTPGQRIVLEPATLTEPLGQALASVDPLGLLAAPFRTEWAGVAPIPLGVVPAGDSELTGADIVGAVVGRLQQVPVLAPVLTPLLLTVRATLGSLCGILVRGQDPGAAEPTSPATPAPPAAPGWSRAPVPWRPTVTDDRSAPQGGGLVFGTRLPGLLPGGALFPPSATAGVPGPGAAAEPGADAPVLAQARSTGSADALPARRDELSVPVLAAVLLLAAVSAALVRRWVLRGSR